MDSLKEEKEGLEELIANNQEKIDHLQTKVNELESHLESCSIVKTSLEDEKNRLVQQISFYESQSKSDSDEAVKSLSDKLVNLESANLELNRQMESYTDNVKHLEEERNRLIQQISEFASRSTTEDVDNLKEKLSNLESANQDLNRQLEELKASEQKQQDQVNIMQFRTLTVTEKITNLLLSLSHTFHNKKL
jgi:chromosome segregation ATPase